MQRWRGWSVFLLATVGCRMAPPAAAPSEPHVWDDGLSVRWIYSANGQRPAPLPAFQWLDDGGLLLHDVRLATPTVQRIDPETGQRLPWLDLAKAAAGSPRWNAASEFTWPESFSPDGRHALYRHEGDLWVLEMETATWQRLTTTPEHESAAGFSSDGRRVGFVRAGDLYVYDVPTGQTFALTDDGVETLLDGTLSWVYWEEIFGRRDIAQWWSDDGRSLAFLRSDESEVATSHFVDFEPWTPRVHTQRYPKAGTPNPDVTLGVVRFADDGAPSDVTWIDPDAVPHEYVVRVRWTPEGDRLAVQTLNRAQTELTLWWVDPDDGTWTEAWVERDDGWVNLHDDLVFASDGEHFFWQSERSGYAHLYRHHRDGREVNAVTSGEWAVRASGGVFWRRQALAAANDEWVWFTGHEASALEKQLYRCRHDGTDFTRLSEEAGTHRITARGDGAFYVDIHSDARHPPRMTLHAGDGRLVMELASRDDQRLKELSLQQRESMTIPAEDGFPMPADLLVPADFDASKPHPVIVHVYGGPSAPTVQNDWDTDLYFDNLLVREGFVVLRVDNRSATAQSRATEKSILGHMYGGGELQDLDDAMEWLGTQPWADAERVGLWGWSGGGTFTLLGMTGTERFRAGVAVAAVTDWRFYDTKWAEFAMRTPEENPEGYAAFDLSARAKDLHGRLLFVHGTHDDNVHPANFWRFTDALIDAGQPFDMLVYPMRKHGIGDAAARIHLFEAMLAFWCRELVPGA